MTGVAARVPPPEAPRLLAGPPPAAGAERFAAHQARLGPLPPTRDRSDLIPVLEASGLLGRGGAGFPVGRKWRAVAERSSGDAVVVVNGAEGEPRSAKDRALMEHRPHLVLDGAIAAADAVGAREIVLYVGSEHLTSRSALTRAVAEREHDFDVRVRLVTPPVAYVAGEASAAIHYINAGDPRPTFQDQRPHERGVDGRPTLVQNVESLAHAALIARFGDAWYRAAGRGPTRGTALVTLGRAGSRPEVHEIEYGTTIGELELAARWAPVVGHGGPNHGGSIASGPVVAGRAAAGGSVVGGRAATGGAVLLGGYFGGWAALDEIRDLPLDPATMRDRGLGFGCGIVSFKTIDNCGVRATADIMAYMAGASAAQCGPCVFGLAALSQAIARLAGGSANEGDLARIERWAGLVEGRGACHHPDGAIGLLRSALRVFADDFELHQAGRGCTAVRRRAA